MYVSWCLYPSTHPRDQDKEVRSREKLVKILLVSTNSVEI